MTNASSDSFSVLFVAQLERATRDLPDGYRGVTWANSEKGPVAAMVGPAQGPFVVGLEEDAVWLIDKHFSDKLEVGPVADVTGAMVAALMQDALTKRIKA